MGKKTWLLLFNAFTLGAWVAFIARVLLDGFQLTDDTALVLAIAQGLAVFEIMNAVLGIAGSNWLLTLLQVSSRLLVTALLFLIAPTCPCTGLEQWGYPLIAIAWGLTEMVRALSYISDMKQLKWKLVNWLRYSMFLVLYPMGVTGEFLIMYGFWQWNGGAFDLTSAILAIIAASYVVFFPKLFGHMLKQRKRKLS